MKKSILQNVLAAIVVMFTLASCEKEGLNQGPAGGGGGIGGGTAGGANLTIATVSGPDKEPCGGFKWRVKFTLNAKSKMGGWIVQKITYDQVVIKCPNTEFINKKI